MQLQTLQFAIIATMISITQAFVKIEVSKLTTTTPVIPNETSKATVTTTLPITQSNFAIDKTVDSITTSQNTTVNSRSKPETNQTEIKVIRPILDGHIPRTSRIKISSDTYYCACDLMINLCDTNCCCDNDCSDDMLSVFVCDENHLGIYNYEVDAGLTSCEIKNELFCVVGNDIVSRNEIFDLSLLNKRRKFKWPTAFANDWTNDVNRHSYKSGDSVLIFDDRTEQTGTLEIPYSLTGDHCHINIPVKYLDYHESKCLRSLEQIQMFLEDFEGKLKSIKVLNSRKVNHALMMEHCTDLNNHCLNIQIFNCLSFLSRENCMNSNSTEMEENWINKEIVLVAQHF